MPGADAERFHRALDERGVPWQRVATGFDVSPRLGVSVVRAVRAARPDLLHTHMVHGDVYGSVAANVLRLPFVSSRHNDDRYLLGPFRYVDRAFMRRVRRLVAISDSVREFLVARGPAREQAADHPLRARRAAERTVGADARSKPACPQTPRWSWQSDG